MKVCNLCKEVKELTEFYRRADPGKLGRVRSLCKKCYKDKNKAHQILFRPVWNRKRRYGLSSEDYDTLYNDQEGKCWICRAENEDLVVDHDHVTLKVRGLLCDKCNKGLGMLQDNARLLENALLYLKGEY